MSVAITVTVTDADVKRFAGVFQRLRSPWEHSEILVVYDIRRLVMLAIEEHDTI